MSLIGATNNVSNPTRLMNIVMVMTTSLASLNSGVIPKLSPQVTLLTETVEIWRLKIFNLSFPLAKLMILRKATVNVVVLIPPAVEPGDPPIHINSMVNMMVGKAKPSISTTLSPAVREDVPVKNAATHFLHHIGCSASVWLYSKMNVLTVPNTMNTIVT